MSKSNKGSSSRKNLIKSRKSGTNTRKMRGGSFRRPPKSVGPGGPDGMRPPKPGANSSKGNGIWGSWGKKSPPPQPTQPTQQAPVSFSGKPLSQNPQTLAEIKKIYGRLSKEHMKSLNKVMNITEMLQLAKENGSLNPNLFDPNMKVYNRARELFDTGTTTKQLREILRTMKPD